MKKTTFLIISFLAYAMLYAQQPGIWNKKNCAVVLTYDDALNEHLTHALPALNRYGLKATFYLSDYFGGLRKQLPGWRTAAARGHELGNHTIYHPCLGNRPGREFVKPETDMNNYSVRRIQSEIITMNTLLQAIDGKTRRTFAFPCSDTRIRDTAYIDGIRNEFAAARAVRSEMHTINKVELYNVASYMVNGETGEQLIELVKKAEASHQLLIFLFHGVGGGHGLNVSLEAHDQLLIYLKKRQKQIWVAPLVQVADYIITTSNSKIQKS